MARQTITKKTGTPSGKADATPAGCLRLAAAPTFGLMAVLSGLSDEAGMVCTVASPALPVDSMAWMYLLMCLFHLPPWFALLSGLRRQAFYSQTQQEGT